MSVFIVTLASADLKQTREETVEASNPETAMTIAKARPGEIVLLVRRAARRNEGMKLLS
jgi:hypothetical protein